MLTFGLLSGTVDQYDLMNRVLIWLPLAIVSLTLHEFGHAATAYALGDQTPKLDGRVTLNPFAHLELFGTLMMLFGPIGWAKPVRIDPRALKGRFGDLVVSVAGPGMNLVIALVAACALKYAIVPQAYASALDVVQAVFFMNVGLAVFNLLPIPPLDGGHIWPALLPARMHRRYYQILPYGMIGLILLVMWPGANHGLSHLIDVVAGWVFSLLP